MFKYLKDVIEEDKESIGMKAYNCAFMFQKGINVPNGFVLYNEITDDDFSLAEEFMTNKGYFVARSSMGGEDQNEVSFAGKYLTIMNITASKLKIAVRKILNQSGSVTNKAVLVQHFIKSEASGVIFTLNPINGEGMLVNSAFGIGENIVSGIVTPDEYIVFNNTIQSTIKQKAAVYTYVNDEKPGESIILNGCRCRVVIENEGRALLSVYFTDRYKPSLTEEQLLLVKKEVEKIKKLFNKEQDIEFAFYKNKLYTMQSRPITSILTNNKNESILAKKTNNMRTIIGEKVSSGSFIGKAVKIEYGSPIWDTERFNNAVLVIDEFYPEIIYSITKIGAIVTAKGGKLSHAAILCRERSIPCVTGIEEKINYITNGDEIFVDANDGKVILYG